MLHWRVLRRASPYRALSVLRRTFVRSTTSVLFRILSVRVLCVFKAVYFLAESIIGLKVESAAEKLELELSTNGLGVD